MIIGNEITCEKCKQTNEICSVLHEDLHYNCIVKCYEKTIIKDI